MILRSMLVVSASFVLAFAPSAALAQSQADLTRAKQRIAELERQLKDRDKRIELIETQSRKSRADDDKRIQQLENDLRKTRSDYEKRLQNLAADVRDRDMKIVQLRAEAERQTRTFQTDKADLAARLDRQTKQIADLERRIAVTDVDEATKLLQRDLADRERKIGQLMNQIDGIVQDRKNDLATIGAMRREHDKFRRDFRELETIGKANTIHAGFYRLKKTADAEEIDSFLAATPRVFGKLPGVRGLWVGKAHVRGLDPAAFDVGFIVLVDDADSLRRVLDHPAYTNHLTAIHRSFDPAIYSLNRE